MPKRFPEMHQKEKWFLRIIQFLSFVFILVFSIIEKDLKAQDKESTYAGKLLVAASGLKDPNFFQTVVFILENSDQGSVGLITNRLVAVVSLKSLGKDLGIDHKNAEGSVPLHFGGPVQPEKFFALHSNDFSLEQTSEISSGLAISPASEIVESISNGGGPSRILFALGYAGWAPNQLEDEIKVGSWHIVPADLEIIFGGRGQAAKWRAAIKRIPADL